MNVEKDNSGSRISWWGVFAGTGFFILAGFELILSEIPRESIWSDPEWLFAMRGLVMWGMILLPSFVYERLTLFLSDEYMLASHLLAEPILVEPELTSRSGITHFFFSGGNYV